MDSSPQKTPDDVRRAVDDGTVLAASREDLEQLLLANCRARILNDANQARAAEMGETMRQLLAARQSQQLHSQATLIAVVALVVAFAALSCSAVDAYYSFAAFQRGNMQPQAAIRTPVEHK